MLYINDKKVKEYLLKGRIGLELEAHRVTGDAHLAHSGHPFPDDPQIVRDYSEDQIEINTTPEASAGAAFAQLSGKLKIIREKLLEAKPEEYLWPSSNPPFIKNEEDIEIARFGADKKEAEEYRKYLSDKYGRYLMTYSGIHFNYSFDDELLYRNYELSNKQGETFKEYKNRFYLELAEKAAEFGWLITVLTAASPLMDSSFFDSEDGGHTIFNGMASQRCGENGYWNTFSPVFDYDNMDAYTRSIDRYVDLGMLTAERELYFPVRIKPRGTYSTKNLRENGADHIELRMIDLNPLRQELLDKRDVEFMQLFLVWLASFERCKMDECSQIRAIGNLRHGAAYDLKNTRLLTHDGRVKAVEDEAEVVLLSIKEFWESLLSESIFTTKPVYKGYEDHNLSDMCHDCNESHSARDMCHDGDESHNVRGMCHDGDESHNIKDACYEGECDFVRAGERNCVKKDVGCISLKEAEMRTKRQERIQEVLSFEMDKIKDRRNRYAYQVRKRFGEDFVSKTMKIARDMSLRQDKNEYI